MEMFFALAMPLIGSYASRARFRQRLQSFENNEEEATKFSSEGLHFYLDDDDAEQLGRAAQCSTHIESFHLDVTGITPSGCTTLVDFFATSPKLTTVMLEGDLDSPSSKRQTYLVTNRLLAAMQRNSSITNVDLSNSHFSTGSLANLLRPASSCHVRKLVLVDCWTGATPAMSNAMARALKENSSLEDVTLVLHNDLVTTVLQQGLIDHQTVKKLFLGTLEPTAGVAVRQVLDSSTKLNALVIERSNLTAQLLQPIVAGLLTSSVLWFSVHRCELDASAVNALKTLLRSNKGSVERFCLSESILTAAMMAEIAQSLHRNTNIAMLAINGCSFDQQHGARHIRDLLRRNRHLIHLDIELTQLGRTGAVEIANGLTYNRTLKHLDCSQCDLGDMGAILLTNAVALHPTLTNLVLCGNNIGSLGVQHFAQTLARLDEPPKLEHLLLDGNSFGDEGAFYLAALLRSNTSLKGLHVAHCGLTGEGFGALVVGLRDNTTLELLDANGIRLGDELPEQAGHALAECLPRLSLKCLYFNAIDSPRGATHSSTEQQEQLLRGLDQNTSLTGVSMCKWFFNEERKRTVAYYIVRNTIIPLVNQSSNTMETAASSAGAEDSTNNDKMPWLQGVWPCVLSNLSRRSNGASAIFFALTSRPDLVATESSLEAVSPSPVTRKRRREIIEAIPGLESSSAP
jgi:Leucine Rich repeat